MPLELNSDLLFDSFKPY